MTEQESAKNTIIEIDGKKYRVVTKPILKSRDQYGVCTIYGFSEVGENEEGRSSN